MDKVIAFILSFCLLLSFGIISEILVEGQSRPYHPWIQSSSNWADMKGRKAVTRKTGWSPVKKNVSPLSLSWLRPADNWWVKGYGNADRWQKEGEVWSLYPPGLERQRPGFIDRRMKPSYFWGLGYSIGVGEGGQITGQKMVKGQMSEAEAAASFAG